MPTKFVIPKLTDREVVRALGRIRAAVKPELDYTVSVHQRYGPEIQLIHDQPELVESLQFILAAENQTVHVFHLKDPRRRNGNAVEVHRHSDQPFETVYIQDEWIDTANEGLNRIAPQLWVKLVTAVRTELKAADAEAAFRGHDDNAWSRFRDLQVTVLSSLQQTSEALLVKSAERNAALDKARDEKTEAYEATLRAELDEERKAAKAAIEARETALAEREKKLSELEAGFETKEASYVARKKQDAQIEQLQGWIKEWSLTKGTTKKRQPVFWGYVVALVSTAAMTAMATYTNFELFKSADAVSKLVWWQLASVSVKTLFPFAAFTTFLIYFIRWVGEWARQHADEEFRIRTRLIDIGRSSWLLEAIRDANEQGKVIPQELLRDLSRNLFSNSASGDADLHPQALADTLLQGLSSVRVKSPDGAEIEASRKPK